MKNFDELLEQEELTFESIDDYLLEFVLSSVDEEEITEIKEEFGIADDDTEGLVEQLVRRVSADGRVRRTKSRKTRKRRATATTGMSKAELKRRARKSARTRKKNPGTLRKALKKRRKALRKRRQYGIK